MGSLLLIAVIFVLSGLAAVPVVLAHSLGRHAFARVVKLPLERVLFPRLAGPGRTRARLGALAAGTAAAYLAVAALAFALATCQGLPTGRASVEVAAVLDGFDAAGKLQPGDRIVAVDGEPLRAGVPPSLLERVAARQGAPVTLTVDRAGARLDVTIQPRLGEAGGAPAWLLGVRQRQVPEIATDAATAAAFAIRYPIRYPLTEARATFEAFASIFTGEEDDEADPGGPVRIVEEFRREASSHLLIGLVRVYALPVAAFALLVLALLDLAGAVGLVRARARRRRAGVAG